MQLAWKLETPVKKNLLFFFFFVHFFKKNDFFILNLNIFFFFKLKHFFQLNNFYKHFIKNNFQLNYCEETSFFITDFIYKKPLLKKQILDKKFYFKKVNGHLNGFNFFLNFDKKFYYKLLDFFFLNSFLPRGSFFPRTGFFNLFFFKNSKGSSYVINLNKVMSRWIDFFNLSLNMYLFHLNPLVYSSPFFKAETLALNWNLNIWDVRSWKYTYPHFIFKTNYFSQTTKFFYNKLAELDYDLFVVTDCLYHFKNLYFFKKNYFYTIGLITLNINPWVVSYPIIASSNSYLNQIFFLQALVYSQKRSFLLQFFFFKKIWAYSFYIKFFS